MATLLELVSQGKLIKYDPQLDGSAQEERVLYGSPRFANWVEMRLPSLESTWGIDQSPAQQFDGLMEAYASKEVLVYGMTFKDLRPLSHGIWEFKTQDLRIFGWFFRRDCFVADAADTADRVKLSNMYHGYISQAVRARELLELDEPKFISGNNIHDVVSNASYA